MTLDFTLDKYAQLCETVRSLDCPVMTVKGFFEADQPQRFVVVLRHDVDRQMGAALRMAEFETRYGIAATYYVRMTPAVFKPEALRKLHDLGHEVGYHYEVLAKAKGDAAQAIALFEQELQHFRKVVPVDTVSMHGSPLLRWDNRDLWCTYDFQDCSLVGEAYLSIDYSEMHYFTDTGRTWCNGLFNLRDHVASREPPRRVCTTDDLIAFLNQDLKSPVLISAHPNRWAKNQWSWVVGAVSDWLINRAKRVVVWGRDALDQ